MWLAKLDDNEGQIVGEGAVPPRRRGLLASFPEVPALPIHGPDLEPSTPNISSLWLKTSVSPSV